MTDVSDDADNRRPLLGAAVTEVAADGIFVREVRPGEATADNHGGGPSVCGDIACGQIASGDERYSHGGKVVAGDSPPGHRLVPLVRVALDVKGGRTLRVAQRQNIGGAGRDHARERRDPFQYSTP